MLDIVIYSNSRPFVPSQAENYSHILPKKRSFEMTFKSLNIENIENMKLNR